MEHLPHVDECLQPVIGLGCGTIEARNKAWHGMAGSFMARKRKSPPISREQMLNSRVARNAALRVERSEDSVTLWVTLPPSPLLRRFPRLAGKAVSERRIELDEVGAFVWDLCDEKTPVRAMIDRLCERYKMNRKEAEVALLSYLRTLAKKRLVFIVVPKEKEGSGDASGEA